MPRTKHGKQSGYVKPLKAEEWNKERAQRGVPAEGGGSGAWVALETIIIQTGIT